MSVDPDLYLYLISIGITEEDDVYYAVGEGWLHSNGDILAELLFNYEL